MRVLILANGEPPSPELAQRLAAEQDLILATDGAAHHAVALGITPDIVCGDFDSVHLESAQAAFPDTTFLPTPDQDFADLEKALHIALERGAKDITLLGAEGGRTDHTLASFALLLRYQAHADLRLHSDHAIIRALAAPPDQTEERQLLATPGDTISLITFSGVQGVTIQGVRWPLDDFALPIGTHGVSNIAEAENVTVRVRGGSLLLCHLFQAPPSRA